MNYTDINAIIEKYNLKPYYKALLIGNPGTQNPYHNTHHALTVFTFCNQIADAEHIDVNDRRALLAAALMHDYGHSGGELTDAMNVKIALQSFRIVAHSNNETLEFINQVTKIIEATQYPYVVAESMLIPCQKIIRDADLLQWTTGDWFQIIIVNLMLNEMKLELTAKNIDLQINFYKGLTFHTEYAQKIVKKSLPRIIEIAESIKSML